MQSHSSAGSAIDSHDSKHPPEHSKHPLGHSKRPPGRGRASPWVALLASTALTATPLAAVVALIPVAALADGGRGGDGGTNVGGDAAGGAGGTGWTGSPGQDSQDNGISGGGGGGGGAGGGTGGSQPVSDGDGVGGAGGTHGTPNGIAGTTGAPGGHGGGGGGGGAHGNGNLGTATILNTLILTGGAGGDGGQGGGASQGQFTSGGGGGGGGAGGYGAVVTGEALSSTSTDIILGGQGGAGGSGGDSGAINGNGGSGGDGGVGVQFTSSGHAFVNSNIVLGGRGGLGGAPGAGPGTPGTAGADGLGGAGIVGSDLTIVNNGTIAGGMSGDGNTQSNAITFTGGNNALTFGHATSGLLGDIGIEAGSLSFLQNNGVDTTIHNNITGAGSVIMNGTDTVTLTGMNSYTGTTDILSGTLRAGSHTALSYESALRVNTDGTLRIADNVWTAVDSLSDGSAGGGSVIFEGDSMLSIVGSSNTTFSGVFSGMGGLEVSGGGVLTLTGTGSQLGGLVICSTCGGTSGLTLDGGTLDIRGEIAAVFVDGNLNVTGGAHLSVINSLGPNGVVFLEGNSSSVSGSGSTLSTDHLQIGDGFSGGASMTIDNGGTVIARSSMMIESDSILFLGSGSLAGAVGTPLILNHGAIIANFSDTSTLPADIIGDGNLFKEGTGTLVLTGSNSYTGPTDVAQGTLIVNGEVSSLTRVHSGGTLGGTGIVGETQIQSGGTLAPGNSIGTLTVNGNLGFAAGSFYRVEVSPTTSDRTNVTGSATLAGTVHAAFQPGAYLERSYTILSADSGLGGTEFGAVTTENLPASFDVGLSYSSNDVLLNLFAQLGALPGDDLNRNQQNIAASMNAFFNAGGTLPPGFVSVFGLTGGDLQNALAQMSGENAAGIQQSANQSMGMFLNTMLDPFMTGRGDSAGGPALSFAPTHDPRDAFAADMPLKAPPSSASTSFAQRWSVWGSAFGGRNRTDGDAAVGSSNLSARAAGFAAGADYRASYDTVLGLAVAIGETNWSSIGSGKTDTAQVGGYAATRWGDLYLSGALAFAWHNATTDRTLNIAGADHLRATFNAQSFGGRVESGYRFALADTPVARLGLTPYAAVQLQSLRTPGYAENAVSGSNQFALAYASQTVTDTRTELGFWLDSQRALHSGAHLTLRGRAAWVHDFDPESRFNAAFQTLPGASFTVDGAAAPRNAALLSSVAELELRERHLARRPLRCRTCRPRHHLRGHRDTPIHVVGVLHRHTAGTRTPNTDWVIQHWRGAAPCQCQDFSATPAALHSSREFSSQSRVSAIPFIRSPFHNLKRPIEDEFIASRL